MEQNKQTNKQYTKTIRDLIVITVFFIFCLDLIIGLIMSSRNRCKKSELASLLGEKCCHLKRA